MSRSQGQKAEAFKKKGNERLKEPDLGPKMGAEDAPSAIMVRAMLFSSGDVCDCLPNCARNWVLRPDKCRTILSLVPGKH